AEVKPANTVSVKAETLAEALRGQIEKLPGFHELERHKKEHREPLFPLMQHPRLVVYPWKDRMLLAWATHGYAKWDKANQRFPEKAGDAIAFGQMFFDAETGELFLFAPTRKDAENPTTGSGLGTLPLGGPFGSRPLQIVRIDATSTYRLKNT